MTVSYPAVYSRFNLMSARLICSWRDRRAALSLRGSPLIKERVSARMPATHHAPSTVDAMAVTHAISANTTVPRIITGDGEDGLLSLNSCLLRTAPNSITAAADTSSAMPSAVIGHRSPTMPARSASSALTMTVIEVRPQANAVRSACMPGSPGRRAVALRRLVERAGRITASPTVRRSPPRPATSRLRRQGRPRGWTRRASAASRSRYRASARRQGRRAPLTA